MTSYQRQLDWLLPMLEMDKDEGNRRLLDRAIKRSLSLPADAPAEEVEARLDAMPIEERLEFIDDLQRQLLVSSR